MMSLEGPRNTPSPEVVGGLYHNGGQRTVTLSFLQSFRNINYPLVLNEPLYFSLADSLGGGGVVVSTCISVHVELLGHKKLFISMPVGKVETEVSSILEEIYSARPIEHIYLNHYNDVLYY